MLFILLVASAYIFPVVLCTAAFADIARTKNKDIVIAVIMGVAVGALLSVFALPLIGLGALWLAPSERVPFFKRFPWLGRVTNRVQVSTPDEWATLGLSICLLVTSSGFTALFLLTGSWLLFGLSILLPLASIFATEFALNNMIAPDRLPDFRRRFKYEDLAPKFAAAGFLLLWVTVPFWWLWQVVETQLTFSEMHTYGMNTVIWSLIIISGQAALMVGAYTRRLLPILAGLVFGPLIPFLWLLTPILTPLALLGTFFFGKSCGNCRRIVPRKTQVGDRCPHCGAHFGRVETL